MRQHDLLHVEKQDISVVEVKNIQFLNITCNQYSTTSNAEKTLYTSELFFEDVQTSANGDYKCSANFQIKGKNTNVESNAANVYVRCKLLKNHFAIVSTTVQDGIIY